MIHISIIIPVYKVEPYIRRCLQSVLSQTYENVECIIVNDATPDKSMEIVDEILKNYNGLVKVKVINHEKNKGLSAARNLGVRAATGDYLFFLDSDDELYDKDTIELFCKSLEKYGNVDLGIGKCNVIGGMPLCHSANGLYKGNDVIMSYLKNEWSVIACAKFIRRSFFLKYDLWFAKGVLHEDISFSFKAALFASSMFAMSFPVYSYYIHENSITTQMRYKNYVDYLSNMNDNWNLLKETYPLLAPNSHVTNFFTKGLFGFFVSSIYNPQLSSIEKEQIASLYNYSFKKMNLRLSKQFKILIEYILLFIPSFMSCRLINKLKIGKHG